MEGDRNGVSDGENLVFALADAAMAVRQLNAAGFVAHELDDAALGADFVGVWFLDRINLD
jgi:hypothetical protein